MTTTPFIVYPGGKRRLFKLIDEHIPAETEVIISPFLGGGACELQWSARGVKVIANDNHYPLIALYRALLFAPEQTAKKVKSLLPLEREAYYPMRNLIKTEKLKEHPLPTQGAITFLVSRHAYAGIMSQGYAYHDGLHERVANVADRLASFYSPNLYVSCLDFAEFLEKNSPKKLGAFCYADPPYWNDVSLLSYPTTNKSKFFDHEKLADMLLSRGNFLLSYNDCDEVRATYKGCEIIPIQHKYQFRNNKGRHVSELLIRG